VIGSVRKTRNRDFLVNPDGLFRFSDCKRSEGQMDGGGGGGGIQREHPEYPCKSVTQRTVNDLRSVR
jgi:hypothetical protein